MPHLKNSYSKFDLIPIVVLHAAADTPRVTKITKIKYNMSTPATQFRIFLRITKLIDHIDFQYEFASKLNDNIAKRLQRM